MDFSNSSKPPVFLSFLTKDLTAFSVHLSSCIPSPFFFKPNKRLTTGDARIGRMEDVIWVPDDYDLTLVLMILLLRFLCIF